MSTDHDDVLIASRLREARTAIGLTQDNVATAVGIRRTAVSATETGNRRITGLELRRLARLYRRPVGWFLGEEIHPIPDEPTNGKTQREAVATYEREHEQPIIDREMKLRNTAGTR
jgi:transcriptional regulator with XRE-family HTH domain